MSSVQDVNFKMDEMLEHFGITQSDFDFSPPKVQESLMNSFREKTNVTTTTIRTDHRGIDTVGGSTSDSSSESSESFESSESSDDDESKLVFDKDYKYNFPEESIKGAEEIYKNMVEDEFRWIILCAQMQSGKTNCYQLLMFKLLLAKKVDGCIIICGFSDKQLISKTKELERNKLKGYLQKKCNYTHEEACKFLDDIEKKIKVLKPSELKNNKKRFENTLFIWEESHYAQDSNNIPAKFLKRQGISANGDIISLNNNYFLSVSATPYAEKVDFLREKHHKKIVKLTPGKNYRGVDYYNRNDKIIIMEENVINQFESLIIDNQNNSSYSIIRISKKEKLNEYIEVLQKYGIDYILHDQNDKNNINKYLKKKPPKLKVIFVINKLRMGEVIIKDYLNFLMETSNDPNTDTILQSFIGRVCGYNITNDDIKIYLPNRFDADELERYISFYHYGINNSIPEKAKNIKNNKSDKYIYLTPIKIQPTSDEKPIFLLKQSLNNPSINFNDFKYNDQIEELLNQKLYTKQDITKETYKVMPSILFDSIQNKKSIEKIPTGCGCDSKPIIMWKKFNEEHKEFGFDSNTYIFQIKILDNQCTNLNTTKKEIFSTHNSMTVQN